MKKEIALSLIAMLGLVLNASALTMPAYAQPSLVGKWNIVEVIKNMSTSGTITFTPNTFSETKEGHTITGTYSYTGRILTIGGIQFSQAQAGSMSRMSGISGMDSNNHIEFHTSDAVLHLMR